MHGPIEQNWSKIFTLPESSLLTLTITFWPIRPRSIITWLVIVTWAILNRFFRCLLNIEFQYACNLMSLKRVLIFWWHESYHMTHVNELEKNQVIRDLWLIVLRFRNRNVLYLKRTECEISNNSTPSLSSKHRPLSNECNGNNSLSPEWILHSFGLENTVLFTSLATCTYWHKLTWHKHCSNDVLEW